MYCPIVFAVCIANPVCVETIKLWTRVIFDIRTRLYMSALVLNYIKSCAYYTTSSTISCVNRVPKSHFIPIVHDIRKVFSDVSGFSLCTFASHVVYKNGPKTAPKSSTNSRLSDVAVVGTAITEYERYSLSLQYGQ